MECAVLVDIGRGTDGQLTPRDSQAHLPQHPFLYFPFLLGSSYGESIEAPVANTRRRGGLATASVVDASGRPLSAGVSRATLQGSGLHCAVHDTGAGKRGHTAANPPLWLRWGDPVQRHPDDPLGAWTGPGLSRRRRTGLAAIARRCGLGGIAS